MAEKPEIARLIGVGTAYAIAQAQADAGLAQFNALQMVADETKRNLRAPDYLGHLRHAVPAATCLSLAAELLLKVAHFQSFGSYSRGHDLVALFALLPTASREAVASAYAQHYRRNTPLAVVHFALSTGGEADPASVVPTLDTIDLALEHLKRAFEAWRYIHESMASPSGAGIHFKALLALIEAIHFQVQTHRGDTRIRFGESMHQVTAI